MNTNVVDLDELTAACRPLSDWWQHFLETGDANIRALMTARHSLMPIKAVGGHLGDVANRLSTGETLTPEQAASDIQLIQRVAHRMPARLTQRVVTPTAANDDFEQLRLPGL